METTLSYLALALSAATLLVTIYLAIRLKTVHYLLQQPVVKKMSPQLRLKPVKLDEALDRNRNRGQGDRQGGRDGGRPERRESREGRPEGERRDGRPERSEGRPERREGDRSRDGRPERREGRDGREGRPEGERRDGRPERSEGRPERREGDRSRDGRPERREGRPEGERRPPRDFSENREAPSQTQPEYSAPAAESGSGLPPRRPLPSFSESTVERAETSAPSRESAADTFVGSGDDVQHGRRTQLKKKPRFDFDEAEAPPAV